MWLLFSSVGRKVIMSLSGVFLILFLVFHLAMNLTAVFSENAYNTICELLGSNWYALLGTAVLAGGFAVHLLMALWLSWQNFLARGTGRYAVSTRPAGVSWASLNMLIIGAVVAGFLLLHLAQFWYHMMFAELSGHHSVILNDQAVSTTDGAAFINYYFSHTWVVIAYLLWYTAIYFHLSHGFWSALHSLGLNNSTWLPRLKYASHLFAGAICLGFAFVTLFFYFKNLFA
ncbi:MAG: succinate dehydrogenase cytochrome b subunit [Tannerellaceae bacterium]|jgi:succinate dehydrogenase / fumarate reductase cytochrome b subunit|nr:succinate dehydrogenase cytochrome b subunit [Tannerellaceae bacterium]